MVLFLVQFTLIGLVSITCFNSKTTLSNDTCYSCNIKVLEIVCGVRVTLHHSLRGRNTHTNAYTYTRDICTKAILRNQGNAGHNPCDYCQESLHITL